MSYVIFQNLGVAEVRALTTIGVNVKEGDSPIGHFGTGFKYAVAICLRNGWLVTVYAGDEKFEFGMAPTMIRGQQFNLVTLNGRELGFTTALGKDWEPWMAYRELYCNMLDEGGTVAVADVDPGGTIGTTRVVVWGPGFEKIHVGRSEFLLLDRVPLLVIPEIAEVYKGATNDFFYKGVRVHRSARPMAFTYNALREIALTEDRTAKYVFQINNTVRNAIVVSDNDKHIERSLTAGRYSYEESIDYDDDSLQMGDTFAAVMEKLINERVTDAGSNARQWYRKKKLKDMPDTRPFTEFERRMLNKAIQFCEKCGYDVDRYPIEAVDDLGTGTLAMAMLQERRILMSKQVFAMGTKAVATTLIEEYLHLSTGFMDCTRELQQLLFDRLVMLLEEHVWGEPL